VVKKNIFAWRIVWIANAIQIALPAKQTVGSRLIAGSGAEPIAVPAAHSATGQDGEHDSGRCGDLPSRRSVP